MCGRLSEVFENQAENKGEKSNIKVTFDCLIKSMASKLNWSLVPRAFSSGGLTIQWNLYDPTHLGSKHYRSEYRGCWIIKKLYEWFSVLAARTLEYGQIGRTWNHYNVSD